MTEREAPAAPVPGAAPRTSAALSWWSRLAHPQRGDAATLARLRRARSSLDALGVNAAIELVQRVGARRKTTFDWEVRAALDLARVLANVKQHEPQHPMRRAGWKRFAGGRRESDAGDDRPLLSEARFRRLLGTGDGEEKVAAFTRLVALLGGTVNVQQLADDFLLWNHPAIGDRVRERWAFTYYHADDAAPPAPTYDTEDDAE